MLFRITFATLLLFGGVRLSEAATVGVRITDTAFNPVNITINPGDRVVWTNLGIASGGHDTRHNPSSGATLWQSPPIARNATFGHTFNATGYFPYYCYRHVVGPPGGIPNQTGSVTVASINIAPTVTLVEPANNATFTAPATFLIRADASDANGNLQSVQFFLNDVSQGTDTGAPYAVSVNNLGPGTYSIRAEARDTTGALGVSATHTITVNPPNSPPTIALTSPSPNAAFIAPASFTMRADASDTDGSVASVEFFINGSSRGTDTSDPFELTISDLGVGNYTLTARATDNQGAQTTSGEISIAVNPPNSPPTVALGSPSANSTFTAPASFTMRANATDSDGSVASVEFFVNGASRGTDNSDPFELPIVDLGIGDYTLTARATDNQGAQSTSSGILIKVESGNAAPELAAIADRIIAPLRRIVFTNSAVDPDGLESDLTFSLDSGSPVGASIHPTTGLFTWIPRKFQSGTTNVITVRVTDKGTPPESDTQSFTVVVADAVELVIGETAVLRGQTATVPVYLTSSAFLVGLDFSVNTSSNELSFLNVNSGPIFSFVDYTNGDPRFFLSFSINPGQSLVGTQKLADLEFTIAPNGPSAFIPLRPVELHAVGLNGPITNIFITTGRIAAIGEEPLLDAKALSTANVGSLKLYGIPGESYRVEQATIGSGVSDWTSIFFRNISDTTHHTPSITLSNDITIFRAFRVQP